jgi:alkylation response protein AidB-like acyl-CoA dehydrogenase
MTVATSIHERQELASAVRRCVKAGGGPRPFLATGDAPAAVDIALWSTLLLQVGVGGLIVPESLGGAGAGFAELCVVLRELAAALTPVPALSSAGMATPLLLMAGPPANGIVERLAEGSVQATVAWPDPSYPFSAGRPVDVTELGGGRCTVSGSAALMVDGGTADILIVAGQARGGLVLVTVDATAPGVMRRPMTTLDLTRGMTELMLNDVDGTVLAPPSAAQNVIGAGLDFALVAIAAEQVGIADHCLTAAVEYAKSREQFARPIGSFQAMKHKLVDLLLDVELAKSTLDVGTQAADAHLVAPSPTTAKALRVAASTAKSACGDAAVRIATESLHVFGGIGFTWEHDAHLYFRRAKSLELLLGDPSAHRIRLAAAMGL